MPSYVSTIIICAVLVLIAFFAIRNYIKKLSNGCCGAESDGIKKVKTSDINKNNLEEIGYKLEVRVLKDQHLYYQKLML